MGAERRILFFIVVVSLLISSTTQQHDIDVEDSDECLTHGLNCPGCSLYLAPSKTLGFGRGIIAGKDFLFNDLVDNSPSITVPNEVTEDTILNNYIYSSEDDAFGMITFGPAMIFNHQRQELKDVDHTWAGEWCMIQLYPPQYK